MYFTICFCQGVQFSPGGAVISRGCSCLNCTNQAAGAS